MASVCRDPRFDLGSRDSGGEGGSGSVLRFPGLFKATVQFHLFFADPISGSLGRLVRSGCLVTLLHDRLVLACS